MSHAIYQTKAFILKTKNMRESNMLVYLYTERFGLIYANAQSIRELKSKMRYHMNKYSFVDIDLVLGRNIWRITGINEIKSSFSLSNTIWYRLVSLMSDVLLRLCTGEEKNEQLWHEISLFLDEPNKGKNTDSDEYEIIIMIRILSALGYWNEEDIILSSKDPYIDGIINHVKDNRVFYIDKINNSLYESQL